LKGEYMESLRDLAVKIMIATEKEKKNENN
jgi:hypothetical protein